MSAYEISLLSVIGLNVMLAVSLNMISGFCGQISLGHGAFYGTGAYAAALIMIATRNVPLSLVSAAAVAAMLGIVVGFASLRVRSDFRRDHDRGEFPVHGLRAQAGLARRRDGNQRHSGFRPRRRRQHNHDSVVCRRDHRAEPVHQPVLDGLCLSRGERDKMPPPRLASMPAPIKMERVKGVEPLSQTWKDWALAAIPHPRKDGVPVETRTLVFR